LGIPLGRFSSAFTTSASAKLLDAHDVVKVESQVSFRLMSALLQPLKNQDIVLQNMCHFTKWNTDPLTVFQM